MSSLFIGTGFKQTDAGVIPEEWESVKAGEVGRFRGGNGFPLRFQGETARDYPFYKVSDMNNEGNDTFMVDSNNWISEGVRKQLSATAFPADSIIFAKVGAAVFLERKKILTKPSCIDNNLAALVLDKTRTHVRFVHYSLLNIKFGTFVTATALPSLSGTVLSQITFALPPLPEQRAIAEALSDMDVLISGLDQLITKKRDLKQAAMQQLLTGQRRLPEFSGAWRTMTVGDGVSLFSGQHILAQYCNTEGRGFPYLTGPSDFPDGKIRQTKYTEKPSALCEADDILVTVKGSGSGTLVVADGVYCISRQLMAIRVRDWDRKFVYYSLLQNATKIKSASTGLIPGLSRADILEQILPVPPLVEEQAAVATVLSDMDAELTALEARRDKVLALKQGMMQELLTGRTRLVAVEGDQNA